MNILKHVNSVYSKQFYSNGRVKSIRQQVKVKVKLINFQAVVNLVDARINHGREWY